MKEFSVIIFRDKDKSFYYGKLETLCNQCGMKYIDDGWYARDMLPKIEVRTISVSSSELESRRKFFDKKDCIGEDRYLCGDCYYLLCGEETQDFSFIETICKEAIDEYNQKYHQKYTRFRDIPQLTKTGNWECDFTFPELVKYIENEVQEQGLQMEPDFQRGHIWTEEQQIAFIEFFLRGGKTGRVIYLNNPSWNFPNKEYSDYVCVDGLQRYTAIKRFINNEIPAFHTYYKDYEDGIRMTNTMRLNINDLQSRKEVLQWYIEFNAGGTPHSQSEIDRVRQLLDKEE